MSDHLRMSLGISSLLTVKVTSTRFMSYLPRCCLNAEPPIIKHLMFLSWVLRIGLDTWAIRFWKGAIDRHRWHFYRGLMGAKAGVTVCISVLERGWAAHHQSAQRKQDAEQGLQSHNTVFRPIFTLKNKREKYWAARSKVCHQNWCKEKWPQSSALWLCRAVREASIGQQSVAHLYRRPGEWKWPCNWEPKTDHGLEGDGVDGVQYNKRSQEVFALKEVYTVCF